MMLCVWLLLRVFRVRDVALERMAWILVLLASIAMPLAMHAYPWPERLTPSVGWLPDVANIGAMTVMESSGAWTLGACPKFCV